MTAPIFPREFIAEVARQHGLTAGDILSLKRDKRTFAARRDVIVRLRARGWSSPQIGRCLGRDHTTVLSALKGADR